MTLLSGSMTAKVPEIRVTRVTYSNSYRSNLPVSDFLLLSTCYRSSLPVSDFFPILSLTSPWARVTMSKLAPSPSTWEEWQRTSILMAN